MHALPSPDESAATARHYTNLYFRYNRPGTAQAAHGSCLARGRMAGARVEQPRPQSFGRHAGPNYAVIRLAREPASRTYATNHVARHQPDTTKRV